MTIQDIVDMNPTGWMVARFCEVCLDLANGGSEKLIVFIYNRNGDKYAICKECMDKAALLKSLPTN